LAVFGLVALADVLGNLFIVVKYLGAVYLLWLGFQILRSKSRFGRLSSGKAVDYSQSYFPGLMTTLGNPKAVLFYFSFFPAFVDLANLSSGDLVVILLVTTVAVGGVMLLYSFVVYKAHSVMKYTVSQKFIKYGAASALMGGGLFVALRA